MFSVVKAKRVQSAVWRKGVEQDIKKRSMRQQGVRSRALAFLLFLLNSKESQCTESHSNMQQLPIDKEGGQVQALLQSAQQRRGEKTQPVPPLHCSSHLAFLPPNGAFPLHSSSSTRLGSTLLSSVWLCFHYS